MGYIRLIDKEHQDKFKMVWDKGNYRGGSTALRMANKIFSLIPETATINDYGCGTGRAEVEIHKYRPNQYILMIDITKDAVEQEALNLIEDISSHILFKEADLSDLGDIEKTDWGICINTLMTVQKDKLDIILSEIKRTCNNLTIEMYDLPDNRLGMDLTTVKMNKVEWKEKLLKYWKEVLFEQSIEPPHRYIFVCK